jgi:S-adenosylmethionine synthetase
MIEKVNPSHPDKLADRIAGALVDYCYTKDDRPKCAFEVLIGHRNAYIISEVSVHIPKKIVKSIVYRIAGKHKIIYKENKQNGILNFNQSNEIRCGDNGIFKGVPINKEIAELSKISREIYSKFETDGKYILDNKRLIVCQSNATNEDIKNLIKGYDLIINPLGYWTGGTDVDSGATNRKLGSDMGEAVTGGGLHGKDLSKADVSVNIYAHLKAQETGKIINLCCAIGDDMVDGKPYREIVKIASDYINKLGGFEKLAEWGLV